MAISFEKQNPSIIDDLRPHQAAARLALEGTVTHRPLPQEDIRAEDLIKQAGRGYSLDEVDVLRISGISVPMDLLPVAYWRRRAQERSPELYYETSIDSRILPFSEEALGADF